MDTAQLIMSQNLGGDAPPMPLVNATFRYHATLNQTKTKAAKRPIYDEIEVCVITHPGDKLMQKIFPANDVWKYGNDPESGERVPITYAMRFNDQYLRFKNDAVQTASGTPLAALKFLTPGKVLELKALHIHTAEALAALDGQPLKALGMGGRELKEKAAAYLVEANKVVDSAVLLDEIAQLKAKIASMEGGSATASVADADIVSPFAGMDDEAIKEWIKDATGAKPKGNPSRATLIGLADEINAELAARRAAEKAAA